MKKKVYLCITESLCCTAKIKILQNQLYFNKINLKNQIHGSMYKTDKQQGPTV